MSELGDRWELARTLAVEAGKITLDYYGQDDLQVQWKGDGSPLTLADQAAERWIRDRVATAFPDDALVGEEFGESTGSSEYRWILDPIDGTKSFICGVPLYGTMIGIEQAGRASIGVIYFPALREGMHACSGEGAWYFKEELPHRRATVSKTEVLRDAVVLTTCVPAFAKRGAAQAFAELSGRARLSRTWGDVYGYLMVATGRGDVMIDPFMNLWDAAALLPIMQEAGGRFTDWQGISRIDGGESIGSNGRLHDEILQALADCPPLPHGM